MSSKLPPLNLRSDLTLHDQLKDWVLVGIHKKLWQAADPLPSERVLSQALHLSRATIRLALSELEREGWLERRQGKGTFVKEHKVEQPLARLRGFSENMRQLGLEPSSKVLAALLEEPEERVASALHLSKGDQIAMITRLRLTNGLPLMLERSAINYQLTPGLLDHDLSESLYGILTSVYGLKLKTGEESLEVIAAEPWVCQALGVSADQPVFFTERIVYNDQGLPVEFAERHARSDKCKFKAHLLGDSADFVLKVVGEPAGIIER